MLEHLDQPASDDQNKIFNESVLGLWRRAVVAITTSSPALSIEGLTSDHAYLFFHFINNLIDHLLPFNFIFDSPHFFFLFISFIAISPSFIFHYLIFIFY